MKIAFILFDGITFLDFAGFYDVIYRLGQFEIGKNLSWDICAASEEVTDELGFTVKAGKVLPVLSEYDMVFVPGGMGTRKLQYDEAFVSWIAGAHNVPYKVSVCTGSLLLGAAGLLKGKKATTHPSAYELLKPYCEEVLETRIVHDGNVITGGGVSTSIDLGLYLISHLAGEAAKNSVKKQIDYPYEMQGIVRI
ncbi:thiamine biosynthesis protein ThiJ [Paenibacillus sp. VTT E-133280]|uniref:DJ-1/PfpI family protein n=1 Tax=unclassified Paenibacillus TaxID=185978 RepID=UPI000BA1799A|nr:MULTISPECIES: DJ-1/PfpI family protein [unclassified Paenibacillus]MDH6374024.1 transcriptional regulator GlxA family with amidase domain [Paenibacillus sp. PastF-3]OZQ64711.1 thiamine biosynthesis protein ThiJ [Paenibacillus sp. VTT E-133280]OZQ82712.1 thiamine biosynthesis protein ThiJ [Paenibacillus sp. VTT E-133291]